MPRFFPSSLRSRLTILVVLAVLPALGLMLYTAREQRRLAVAELRSDALRLTGLVALQEEELIGTTRQFLVSLAQLPQVQSEDSASCSEFLADLLVHYHRYANLGLIGADGYVSCSALPTEGPVYAGDRVYFQRAVETRDFAIGDYQIGRITHVPSINFGYPILDDADRVQGVVFAAVGLEWLDRLESEVASQLGQGSTLTKIDAEGTILFRYPDPEKWAGQPLPETSLAETVLTQGHGIIGAPGKDGIPCIHAFSSLRSKAYGGNVYLIVSMPEAAIFSEANRRLAFNLAASGIVALLALAATWIGGDVLILRHVKGLVNATGRLAAGDLSARTALPYEVGELGQLAYAFDRMAEALEDREAKRKRAEEEKERVQAQLLQAQKMEAIGILASGVAHDFNNLLGAIQGYTELAMEEIDEADPSYGYLKRIGLAAERGAGLTRRLIFFIRKQPMEPISLNVNETVDHLLEMLRPIIAEDIAINTDLEPDLWTVRADEASIEQVIMNLTVNAREAMPKGGELTIKTENVTLDGETCKPIPEARPGNFVSLSVADTGVGMDEEIMQHIFEPFFTTKEVGKGAGLGLAVVYGVVKQHEGWINVYSEPGQGSTFEVYLPALTTRPEDETEEAI